MDVCGLDDAVSETAATPGAVRRCGAHRLVERRGGFEPSRRPSTPSDFETDTNTAICRHFVSRAPVYSPVSRHIAADLFADLTTPLREEPASHAVKGKDGCASPACNSQGEVQEVARSGQLLAVVPWLRAGLPGGRGRDASFVRRRGYQPRVSASYVRAAVGSASSAARTTPMSCHGHSCRSLVSNRSTRG